MGSKTTKKKAAKKKPAVTITLVASRCPVCQSERRERYFKTTTQAFAGEYEGRRFSHIIRRWTRCLDCGQVRIDRSYEDRSGKK